MACITPFHMEREGVWQAFPCGKCEPCLKARTSSWSFRLMQEGKQAEFAHFVTLTYDTTHVPITARGFMSLSKRDVQLFFKRLRKLKPNARIKYYVCGEYGGHTMRPHYHAILFNSCPADICKAWTIDGKPIGNVHFGDVSGASIGYTLKYMMKEAVIPMHANDDRIKEFALMSKGWAATI